MNIEQVAIQLYTLRDFLKTPEQVDETMEKVAAIGYQSAQISGIENDLMTEEALVDLFAKYGVSICATHEDSKEILNNPDSVVKRLQALGCTHTAYPYPNDIDLTSEAAVDELIAGLNRAGKVLADAGLTLSYHNHNLEFRKLNGQIILDRILDNTDPAYLKAELDTYWVQYGGCDPVDWCRKVAGRTPLIHLKDYKVTDDNGHAFCEVGVGNLNFPAIIEAAEAGGCEWFIVEQDTCDGDHFEAIARSFDYITTNLVS